MAMAATVNRSGLGASRRDGGADSTAASFEVLAGMQWIVALSRLRRDSMCGQGPRLDGSAGRGLWPRSGSHLTVHLNRLVLDQHGAIKPPAQHRMSTHVFLFGARSNPNAVLKILSKSHCYILWNLNNECSNIPGILWNPFFRGHIRVHSNCSTILCK